MAALHRLTPWVVTIWLLFSGMFSLAQEQIFLDYGIPFSGTLGEGQTHTWYFDATEGAMVSVAVLAAEDSTLDPTITILDTEEDFLLINTDARPPNDTDAILEGFTIPDSGTYAIVVEGANGSTGDYDIHLTQGYAERLEDATLDNLDEWEVVDQEIEDAETTVTPLFDEVLVETEGRPGSAWLTTDFSLPNDVYIHNRFSEIQSSANWEAAITFRQTGVDTFYEYRINNLGRWRFTVTVDGETNILRDWQIHPGIAPNVTSFSLGVLTQSESFELFYNGFYLVTVRDDTIPSGDEMGLILLTGGDTTFGRISGKLSNLILTTPSLDADGNHIFPSSIIATSPNETARELKRRFLIPSGGDRVLSFEEINVRDNRIGVRHFPIGLGLTYTDFVVGAMVQLDPFADTESGCGLSLRKTSDTDYVFAFIDQTGAFGISQSVDDAFQPGVYVESDEDLSEDPHQMTIIAIDDTVHMYLDGQYAGMIEMRAVSGEISNAIVNFERVDSLCTFFNTYVWSLDDL